MKKINETESIFSIIKLIVAIPFVLLREMFAFIGKQYNRFLEKLRFSITLKITAAYVFFISFILLLINVGVAGGFTVYLIKNAQNEMQSDFKLISQYISEERLPEDRLKSLADIKGLTITIFNPNKEVIYTSAQNKDEVIFYDDNKREQFVRLHGNFFLVEDGNKKYSNISKSLNNVTLNYGAALILNSQKEQSESSPYIQVFNGLQEEHAYIGDLFLIMIGSDIVILLMVIISGSRVVKKNMRPVAVMTDTVKNITINALDTRLDIRGSKNELKDLAKTFNGMLDRIQRSYEQQNQFVSDASHELRTPISVIQGYANLLDRWGKEDKAVLEEAIAAIKTESQSMKELIEKLLFLARGDKNAQKIEIEEFYTDEFIDEIVKETKLIDNHHEIINRESDRLCINADRKLLKEALRVFIDNSIKYTPEGGQINIDCREENNRVVMIVEDNGMGISREDIPNIFNRFYRADKSRTRETGGTGLGLAIAKWIILKHKGTIEVESQLEKGTKIRVILPIS